MPTIYKRHTIVAGASKSTTAENYIPIAYIAWEITSSDHGSYAMVAIERFATFEEASDYALDAAKAWVDRNVGKLD